ncbi:hypothetical protein [Bradyrhizobium arachidis]|uniref:hypothetical protein n=1 Tax=Bradyrhizobium arachidis TaxID=858423 RepID=UPI0021616016|nr:hypothetical protein [Bradyrhizobium arachidis]UVO30403.1 hypothetical protein KUF59_06680 [Bradyrhizobium arachidis]
MQQDVNFSRVTDSELNSLVEGVHPQYLVPWSMRESPMRIGPNEFGVLWASTRSDVSVAQPLVLIVRKEDQQRLFGRFAQVRSDLSPFSSWCHITTPNRMDVVDDLTKHGNLGDYTAAWTGLVVAETLLLAERPLARIRIPACTATQTFAIARAVALWSPSISEVTQKYDQSQNLFRAEHRRSSRIRSALEPIWGALAALSGARLPPRDERLLPLIEGIHLLHVARTQKDPHETASFLRSLRNVLPTDLVNDFERLSSLAPEERVRAFDKSLSYVEKSQDQKERQILAALTGYLATIAAGGAPSLGLLTASAQRFPEITAWAYVLGGVGEPVVWTSSFDGLGRLVARELLRPLRFDEPPTADFALDEALFLADPRLPDPLVHLRIKQSRIATVALYPGVNLSVPMNDQAALDAKESRRDDMPSKPVAAVSPAGNPWALLAEGLWPYLEDKLSGGATIDESNRTRTSRRGGGGQAKLPLKKQ